MDVKGKNVIVTGAGQGIGEATALMLAELGAAKIVIADLNKSSLENVASKLSDLGAEAIVKVVDVSLPANVVSMFEEADRETGGLDIVFNNAGIMAGAPDFPDTVMENMVRVIQVNLIAMMVGTRIAIAQMRENNRPGVIVNTSSVAAFGTMPADPAYAASKVGILNFTQSCQPLHEQFNIRVMAVCPGVTDTAIVPHDAAWLQPALARVKILQPSDIARAVCGIIADDSLAGDQVTVQNEPVL